jgi:hypothetical protein
VACRYDDTPGNSWISVSAANAAMGGKTWLHLMVKRSARICRSTQVEKRIAETDCNTHIAHGSTAPNASGANMSNAAVE